MAKDIYGYPSEPRQIDEQAWFYEQRGGMDVCVEPDGINARIVRLSWRRLEAAVDRHRAIKRKRTKR